MLQPPTLRLFLGLWPPAPVLAALEAHASAWHWPASARRTPPERLHVTLHFLGEVAGDRLPHLRQALRVPWEPGELVLDRAQVWPGGIAVLEAGTVAPALARLHALLDERLGELGIATEARRWRPHVTFARKAAGAQPPAGLPPVHWALAPEYLLVQSLPGGRGYVALQRFG